MVKIFKRQTVYLESTTRKTALKLLNFFLVSLSQVIKTFILSVSSFQRQIPLLPKSCKVLQSQVGRGNEPRREVYGVPKSARGEN